MQIRATPPFRTGSLLWQEHRGQFSLTVVCKATYALTPLTATLADEPEDVVERDNHWDDDPDKSLYQPSDLVPSKPKPEVVLVGAAFAPRADPVRALFVRLIVGDVDKSVEVFCPRTFMPDGSLREGPRWTQMPLRYERAGGGPETWNPVGLGDGAVDRYGRRALPNLQPPGVMIAQPGDVVPPVGLGPIAPTWPGRRSCLRGRERLRLEDLAREPLGEGFDATYFQVAPLDQRLGALRPDEQIILENLHPDHGRLVTKLPGVRPKGRVETADMPAWDLAFTADTLWIDTLRGICTLTWRAQVPLAERDQRGLVRIGVEEPGRPLRWPSSDAPGAAADEDTDDFGHTATDDEALRALRSGLPVLPFAGAGARRAASHPAAPLPPPPGKPRVPVAPRFSDNLIEEEHTDTGRHVVPPARGSMPTWLDAGAPPAPPGPSGMPPSRLNPPPPPLATAPQAALPAPPPPVPMIMRQSDPFLGMAPSLATASNAAAAQPPPPVSGFGLRAAPPLPEPAMAAPRNERALASAVFAGVFEASSAAADAPPAAPAAAPRQGAARGESVPPPPSPRDDRGSTGAAYGGVLEASNAAAATPAPAPRGGALRGESTPPPPRVLVELIWYEPTKMPRVRAVPGWEGLLRNVETTDEDRHGYDEIEMNRRAAEARARCERADLASILSRAPLATDVEGAVLDAATEEGTGEPPLCVLGGDLDVGLDEVKMLEAMMGAAGSFATGDKKLKEIVDLVAEVMRTPLGASPGVAAGFVTRVRDAWTKANRLLPGDWLDVHTRRLLLEQRAYQKRELWGDSVIRALLVPPGDTGGVPTYLPASVATKLPLFTRFPVRVVAEAFPQQDQLETHPVALRVVALGRGLGTRSRPRPRRAEP